MRRNQGPGGGGGGVIGKGATPWDDIIEKTNERRTKEQQKER